MKVRLGNLVEHLFEQLERLGDEDIDGVKLEDEVLRAKAMTGVAEQIISAGHLALKTMIVVKESDEDIRDLPQMLRPEGSMESPKTLDIKPVEKPKRPKLLDSLGGDY